MGRALYQVIMMILLVMSVAGVAVKLAARFPWLMRLARIISRGGKLEDLEDLRQGMRAVREAENAPKLKPEPPPKPDPKPPEPQKPPIDTEAIQKWKDGLQTQPPGGSNQPGAREFQIRNCGDKEFLVKGGGNQVWADGISDDGLIQDAKYIGDAKKSPYVPGSDMDADVRGMINDKTEKEFARYAAVIKDSETPVTGLQIITNEQQAVPYFQGVMQRLGIPGNVAVKP